MASTALADRARWPVCADSRIILAGLRFAFSMVVDARHRKAVDLCKLIASD
jgi:hypothetical protein